MRLLVEGVPSSILKMSKPRNPIKQRLLEATKERGRVQDIGFILQLVAAAGYTDEARQAASTCKTLRQDDELWLPVLRKSIGVRERHPLFHALTIRDDVRVRWLCKHIHYPLTLVDSDGHGLLWYCVRYEMPLIAYFCERGAQVDTVDRLGQTALFYAIANQRMSSIDALIRCGANLNHRCHATMTPLYVAAQKGNLEIIQFLCNKGARVDEASVVRSVRYGHIGVLQEFLERDGSLESADKNGHSLLHYAVQFNHLTLCVYLLEFLNVNCTSRNQVTPLMLAPSLAIWNRLLNEGALVNRGDINGWTALHYAVHHRRPTIVKALLENGADKSRLTHSGMSAFDLAIVKEFHELVQLLQ